MLQALRYKAIPPQRSIAGGIGLDIAELILPDEEHCQTELLKPNVVEMDGAEMDRRTEHRCTGLNRPNRRAGASPAS